MRLMTTALSCSPPIGHAVAVVRVDNWVHYWLSGLTNLQRTRDTVMAESRGTLLGRRGREVHRRLVEGFADELVRRDPDGRQAEQITDLEEAARAAADRLLDTAALWDEHLGGFYDTEGVRHVLARGDDPISRQAVAKRRDLLALRTGSGRVVYPIFQFIDGRPVEGLGEVLKALPDHVVSRWTVASWLLTPQRDLDGARPIDALADGSPHVVVRAARRWASALAA
jgi:hypothetical protein